MEDDGLGGEDNGLKVKSAPDSFAIRADSEFIYDIDLSKISGCQRIGKSAFEGKGVNSILLPQGIISLGDSAFRACGLTKINIPDSVNTIGKECFAGCVGSTGSIELTIPNSVTSIGESCFRGIYDLSKITIGENITSLPPNCFFECWNLSIINILTENTSFTLEAYAIDTTTSTQINFNSKVLYDKYSSADGTDGWGNGQGWDESFGTTISFSNEYVDPTPDPVDPDQPSSNDNLWSKFMWLWIILIVVAVITVIGTSVGIAVGKKKRKFKNLDKDLDKLTK